MSRTFTRAILASMCALPCYAQAQTAPLAVLPPLPTGPQAPAAPGQLIQRGQTVADRARPEFDPLGLHFGSFFAFPRAEIGESFNSNIFASPKATSDLVTTMTPSIDVLSNFPRHALNLHAGANIGIFAQHSSENYRDAFAATDGTYDITASDHVTGELRAERLHEDRSTPDTPGNAARPVKYTQYTASTGYEHTGFRIGYGGTLAATRQEFEAVPRIGGGLLPQDDRNNNAYEAQGRASYEFSPSLRAFGRAAYNIRRYDHPAAGGPDRDSDGYRADVGARLDLTGVTYLEGYVGYLRQDYKGATLPSIGGLDLGVQLWWNPTQLTSVSLRGQRRVQDLNNEVLTSLGTTINSPGYLDSRAVLNVDHELRRNVILNGNLLFASDDFKGIDRNDYVYGGGVGGKYLLNRHLYLGASYAFDKRDSSGHEAGPGYSRHIIMLRLSTQL